MNVRRFKRNNISDEPRPVPHLLEPEPQRLEPFETSDFFGCLVDKADGRGINPILRAMVRFPFLLRSRYRT
jgi:hypothetical protein